MNKEIDTTPTQNDIQALKDEIKQMKESVIKEIRKSQ